MDVASASTAQLAYVEAERKWTSGGKPHQGRNTQLVPLDSWADVHFNFERVLKAATIHVGRCLIMAGRGWGKTRTGAHWLMRQACLYPGVICHVVAPTYADLRGVIFEGPSGLKATIPSQCVRSLTYSPYPELTLWNGSVIRGFSSEVPDRLRGPQATFVWGDELASWYKATECLANIDFSTRIAYRLRDGRMIQPQKLYTTTPKPLQWLAKMIKDGVRMVRGSTYENRDNLAADFYRDLEQYEGTEIGRQELHGELLDISEAAIIKKSWLKMWPAMQPLPWFEYIMVSMDTAFTEKTFDKKTFASDPTACTVWGVFRANNKWNLLLLEAWEDWLGFPELVRKSRREMKAKYGHREEAMFKPLVGPGFLHHQVKTPDLLIIEDKGSGISLRQMLQNEGQDSYPYNPGNADKLSRLHAVSHLPHAGRIWLPEGARRDKITGVLTPTGAFAKWTDSLLDQLCVYSGPGTTPHDDWVDTCSQAWRVFADKYVASGVDKVIEEVRDDGSGRPQPMPAPPLPEDMRHDRVYATTSYEDIPRAPPGPGAYDG